MLSCYPIFHKSRLVYRKGFRLLTDIASSALQEVLHALPSVCITQPQSCCLSLKTTTQAECHDLCFQVTCCSATSTSICLQHLSHKKLSCNFKPG